MIRRRAASRGTHTYQETFARTDRLRNSPVHYMRRRLNGKEGRTYGERTRRYCDTLGDGIGLVSGPAMQLRRQFGKQDEDK